MYIGAWKGDIFNISEYKVIPEVYKVTKEGLDKAVIDGYFILDREDVYIATQKLEDEQRQNEWLHIKDE